MKRMNALILIGLLCGCATISGTPNFFGIRVKNERAAQDLRVEAKEGTGYEFFYKPGAMDPGIKAEGRLEWHGKNASTLLLSVKNDSDEAFPIAFTLDRFILHTQDGREIELTKQSGFMQKDFRVIAPSKEALFHLGIPVTENLTKEDITKIVCIFGMDQVKVVLVPITGGVA